MRYDTPQVGLTADDDGEAMLMIPKELSPFRREKYCTVETTLRTISHLKSSIAKCAVDNSTLHCAELHAKLCFDKTKGHEHFADFFFVKMGSIFFLDMKFVWPPCIPFFHDLHLELRIMI